jgi:LAO/AO transport system kinase
MAEALLRGDRSALSRAITLAESTRDADRIRATQLLDVVWPKRPLNTLRFAVTGPPGAGKSTLIEQLGSHILAKGRRVAVLAVDPTSRRSGGSILGDKTRMPGLATHPEAFVRPSPSAGNLGGVTRSTRDAVVLCEAAGFDTTIVETVGVGQSEVEVDGLVDFVVLVLLAGAGDELQGIKRGILEVADVLAVNKLDVDRDAVLAARRLYRTALSILEPRFEGWQPPVVACSAVSGEGIADIADTLYRLDAAMSNAGTKQRRRSDQLRDWFRIAFRDLIVERVLARPAGAERMRSRLDESATGSRNPSALARELVAELGAREAVT